MLDHQKSKSVPEKHLLLLYWLCHWLCGSQQTVENSSRRDGNTRPPDLPTEKSVWGSSLAILLSQFGNQSVVPCPVVTVASWPSYRQRRQHIKKQRQHFANNGPSSQSYGFFSSHVWMWELNYKESWAQKNWCFWTVVLEKILESSLECKEIQPVNP